MPNQTKTIVNVVTVCAQCNQVSPPHTLKAYELENGLVLLSKYDLLGGDIDPKQLENATVVSIEETGKQLTLTDEQYLEMFFDDRESKVYIIATKRRFSDLVTRIKHR